MKRGDVDSSEDRGVEVQGGHQLQSCRRNTSTWKMCVMRIVEIVDIPKMYALARTVNRHTDIASDVLIKLHGMM
jgi:hypothetical protein